MKYLQSTFALLTILTVSIAQGNTEKKLNVLWLIIDDQSPWHSIYGNDLVKTPHIDKLLNCGIRCINFCKTQLLKHKNCII